MNIIRLGLGKGFNLRPYHDQGFNKNQMLQILFGLQDGLDVSSYVDKEIPYDVMDLLRESINKRINLLKYYEHGISYEQLKVKYDELLDQRIEENLISLDFPYLP